MPLTDQTVIPVQVKYDREKIEAGIQEWVTSSLKALEVSPDKKVICPCCSKEKSANVLLCEGLAGLAHAMFGMGVSETAKAFSAVTREIDRQRSFLGERKELVN